MQTFLPLPDMRASMRTLDRARLGKQRVEGVQILRTRLGISSGWVRHPAVRMWEGHEWALARYVGFACLEWQARGYTDNLWRVPALLLGLLDPADVPADAPETVRAAAVWRTFQPPLARGPGLPPWWGEPRLHGSHRSRLLAKDFAHYSQFDWTETPGQDYYWPV